MGGEFQVNPSIYPGAIILKHLSSEYDSIPFFDVTNVNSYS